MKSRSPLLYFTLLFYGFLISNCCTSGKTLHAIQATNGSNGQYEVPHIIIGDCAPKGDHSYIAEFSTQSAQDSEQTYIDLLIAKGYSAPDVKKTTAVTRSYNSNGLLLDNRNSSILPKYVLDALRYSKYKNIVTCPSTSPAVGDIIIYQLNNDDGDDEVVHSGKVIEVNGEDVRVLSKWEAGPEYEHNFKSILEDYDKVTYYRKECIIP